MRENTPRTFGRARSYLWERGNRQACLGLAQEMVWEACGNFKTLERPAKPLGMQRTHPAVASGIQTAHPAVASGIQTAHLKVERSESLGKEDLKRLNRGRLRE